MAQQDVDREARPAQAAYPTRALLVAGAIYSGAWIWMLYAQESNFNELERRMPQHIRLNSLRDAPVSIEDRTAEVERSRAQIDQEFSRVFGRDIAEVGVDPLSLDGDETAGSSSTPVEAGPNTLLFLASLCLLAKFLVSRDQRISLLEYAREIAFELRYAPKNTLVSSARLWRRGALSMLGRSMPRQVAVILLATSIPASLFAIWILYAAHEMRVHIPIVTAASTSVVGGTFGLISLTITSTMIRGVSSNRVWYILLALTYPFVTYFAFVVGMWFVFLPSTTDAALASLGLYESTTALVTSTSNQDGLELIISNLAGVALSMLAGISGPISALVPIVVYAIFVLYVLSSALFLRLIRRPTWFVLGRLADVDESRSDREFDPFGFAAAVLGSAGAAWKVIASC